MQVPVTTPPYALVPVPLPTSGGLNQEPDSDCAAEPDDADRQQEEEEGDSRRLGGMSDGGEADGEGEGEREGVRGEASQVINASGESDAPVDVQDLQVWGCRGWWGCVGARGTFRYWDVDLGAEGPTGVGAGPAGVGGGCGAVGALQLRVQEW